MTDVLLISNLKQIVHNICCLPQARGNWLCQSLLCFCSCFLWVFGLFCTTGTPPQVSTCNLHNQPYIHCLSRARCCHTNYLAGKSVTNHCVPLKVSNISYKELLAVFQGGYTCSATSCNQTRRDRSAVGLVLDGDVQSVR